jgi:hypothetical protein
MELILSQQRQLTFSASALPRDPTNLSEVLRNRSPSTVALAGIFADIRDGHDTGGPAARSAVSDYCLHRLRATLPDCLDLETPGDVLGLVIARFERPVRRRRSGPAEMQTLIATMREQVDSNATYRFTSHSAMRNITVAPMTLWTRYSG